MPGIRVRLSDEMTGTIRSEKLFAQRVKTLRPGCDCLRYGPRKEAHFDVASGGVHDLLLEGVGRELTITLDPELPGGEPVVVAVNLAGLTGVAQIVRSETGWELRFGDQPVPEGVSVWWHGSSSETMPGDSTVDEKLRLQLEALGYVD